MKTLTFLVATLFVVGPALGQEMNMQHGGMNMGGSPADQANMQAMQNMQNDMPKTGTGDPDKDFVMMMIPHHQGAIDMAKIELQYGKDPALRKLAESIVKDQEREIGQMKAWLSTPR